MKLTWMLSAFLGTLPFLGCSKGQDETLSTEVQAVNGSGGSYSVTYYKPGDMPVECKTPPGFAFSDGVAVVEGDPLVDGATCPGWSSGLPDCTVTLKQKNLCGRIIEVSYNGKSKKGWLTGICPWKHPNNAAKGVWNPCGQGRRNLDLVDALYFGIGLNSAQSWGPNGSTGTVNPQAAQVQARVVGHIPGVGTIH